MLHSYYTRMYLAITWRFEGKKAPQSLENLLERVLFTYQLSD